MSKRKYWMVLPLCFICLALSACNQDYSSPSREGKPQLQSIRVWQGKTAFLHISYYPEGIARLDYNSGGQLFSKQLDYDRTEFEEIARLVDLDKMFDQPLPAIDMSRMADQPYYYIITLENTGNETFSYIVPTQLCNTTGCIMSRDSDFFSLTSMILELNKQTSDSGSQ